VRKGDWYYVCRDGIGLGTLNRIEGLPSIGIKDGVTAAWFIPYAVRVHAVDGRVIEPGCVE